MTKYKVYGTVVVNVTKEVWANSEDEAFEKAYEQLPTLTAYCGNGGYDSLVGVEGDGESVETYDDIEYNEIRVIEDDPDYFECPECGEQCSDIESGLWWCGNCYKYFNDNGDEMYPIDSEEDDEE